jgi:hypothetical protein
MGSRKVGLAPEIRDFDGVVDWISQLEIGPFGLVVGETVRREKALTSGQIV